MPAHECFFCKDTRRVQTFRRVGDTNQIAGFVECECCKRKDGTMQRMTNSLRDARRAVGLPKFEQECLCQYYNGRWRKRYNIPGTEEAGCYATLNQMVVDRMQGKSYYL